MASYNPEGAKVYEKTDGHKFGRIKGKWEDAMRSAAPDDNERGWNQAAQEAVADGHIDTQAEVDQAAAWLKGNQGDDSPKLQQETATAEPVAEPEIIDSPQLSEAKNRVSQWEEKSWSGERANETFNPGQKPTFDGRDKNSVLNAYVDNFTNSSSPSEDNLPNAFSETAMNQQEVDVPDLPSKLASDDKDGILKQAGNMLLTGPLSIVA